MLTEDEIKYKKLVGAVREIGGCLTDLGNVIIQGVREDNEAARGNIALGLERAAIMVRGGSMGDKYPIDKKYMIDGE